MKRLLPVLLFLTTFLSGLTAREGEVVFVAYNLANYSPLPEIGREKPAKSEASVAALIRVIGEIDPDILGVCEMGSALQFADFRERLAAAGREYPHFEYVDSVDPHRRLALVSRYPIIARHSIGNLSIDAEGRHEKVRRGILDVTLQLREGSLLRVVGVHFKSKLPTPEGEALLRRKEAQAVRRHLDTIFAAAPEVALLLYGDFNETRDEANIRDIAGLRGTPGALTALSLADSDGDRWTYYWKARDHYSRIDYIFTSPAAKRRFHPEGSGIHRSPHWKEASDHRPLVARFRP